MTLLRGDSSLTTGASVCEGCALPIEERPVVIVYGDQGYRLLHSDCWQPGRAGTGSAVLSRSSA